MDTADTFERNAVTVRATSDELVVESARLPLPWQPREGYASGTGVHWQDRLWEVTGLRRTQSGDRWTLRPWPENEVLRRATSLDAAAIEALALSCAEEDRRAKRSMAIVLLMPLAGLLPARLQRRWEREHGHSAVRMTVASAVLELAFSALAPLQVISAIFHEPLLPGRWGALALLALVAGADALLRLVHVRATQEPVGSLFTLPALPFLASEASPMKTPPTPTVAAFDPEHGLLELATPILRPDWVDSGVLEFHGQAYRALGLASHAAPWLYRFVALAQAPPRDAPRLRWSPPTARSLPRGTGEGAVSTILTEALRMTLFAFAPGGLQREWAELQRLPVLTLTYVSGGMEALGGLLSLIREGPGELILVLLDLYLLGEGLVRVGLAAATREPVGSAVGLPWRRLYPHWLAEARESAVHDAAVDPPTNQTDGS